MSITKEKMMTEEEVQSELKFLDHLHDNQELTEDELTDLYLQNLEKSKELWSQWSSMFVSLEEQYK